MREGGREVGGEGWRCMSEGVGWSSRHVYRYRQTGIKSHKQKNRHVFQHIKYTTHPIQSRMCMCVCVPQKVEGEGGRGGEGEREGEPSSSREVGRHGR